MSYRLIRQLSDSYDERIFLSLVAEFVVGYYSVNGSVRCDASSIILAIGSSLLDELCNALAQSSELIVEDENNLNEVEVVEGELELIYSTLSVVIEAISAGQSADGLVAVLNIAIVLVNALALVIDEIGASVRGIALLSIVGEDVRAISFALVSLEILSNVLRPVSLALRIFSNLTSGVLITALSGNGASCVAVSSLLASICDGSNVNIIVASILSIFESAIGVIQSYVFCVLAVQYFGICR